MKHSMIVLAILMASGSSAFALGVGNDNPAPTTDTTVTNNNKNKNINANVNASESTAYGGVSSSQSSANATGGNATGGTSVSNSNATGGKGGAGGAGGSATSIATGGAGGSSGGNIVVQAVSTVDPNSTEVAKIQADAAIAVADRLSDIKIRNVPSMSGPALVSSNDTCMGSGSGAVSGPGFGVSIGTTFVDENCRMLKNAREMWNMGFKAAAVALLCTDVRNQRALEVTGYSCPGGPVKVAVTTNVVAAPVAVPSEPTDPYVRRRMGLPPIKE